MRLVPATLTLLAAACGPDTSRSGLTEDVSAAFRECVASEVSFLSAKHNFQTVFRPCGGNPFETYAWSPAGTHLYFQLQMSGHILNGDAENKPTMTVPTRTPIGSAAWMSANRLVVPVRGATESSPPDLAIFDVPADLLADPKAQAAAQLTHLPLTGFTDADQLAPDREHNAVLFLGTRDGTRGIWRVDLETQAVTPAFAWLDVAPDTFTWSAPQGLVVLGVGDEVIVRDAASGAEKERYPHARRGSLHAAGVWLALEYPGAEISPFYQRSWDELSDAAREREAAKAKRLESELPNWAKKKIRPPMIGVVHRPTGQRFELTSVQGTDFSWYEAKDFYASIFLWGYEGKELKRNVLIGDLGGRLATIAAGTPTLGVRPFSGAPGAPAALPDAPPTGTVSEPIPPAAGVSEPSRIPAQETTKSKDKASE